MEPSGWNLCAGSEIKVWISLKDRKIPVQRLEGDVDENGSDIVKICKCCYRGAGVKRDNNGRVFR